MATMNVSLPDELRRYVDERVETDAFQTSSEYIRELIRQDRATQRFRALIRVGMESPTAGPLDADYFSGVKQRLRASHS